MNNAAIFTFNHFKSLRPLQGSSTTSRVCDHLKGFPEKGDGATPGDPAT